MSQLMFIARVFLLCVLGVCLPAQAAQFSFVALGDTAYNDEADYPVYDALIQRINQSKPAFTIHVGDTWGGSECLEKDHLVIVEWFAKYDHPLVYTPGDNEWTDCIEPRVIRAFWRMYEDKAQPGDEEIMAEFRSTAAAAHRSHKWALDSLERIRRLFFKQPRSLGQRTMPLTRQSELSDEYREFVENARWMKDGVAFATVHVVGSSNGFAIGSKEAAAESVRRNRANVEWMTEAFQVANRQNAKAMVLAMHGQIFDHGKDRKKWTGQKVLGGRRGSYGTIALAIKKLAEEFEKPVLLIHGDWHEFVIDRPFMVDKGQSQKPSGGNITRLQVYGAPELRAVKIDVDTETPWVFSFSPLYDQ